MQWGRAKEERSHFGTMRIREPFNAVSHGVGALAAVVGLVYLVWTAEGALARTSFALYGASLILLYLASTLYHGLPVGPEGQRVLRRIDHSAIYLLIAGSYTPVCLLAAPPAWGWSIFGVVWGLALTGIVLRNLGPTMPRWLYTMLYIAMGWTAVVAVGPLIDTFSWAALAWLVAGGLAYTIGAVLYATEWPDILPRHVGSHGIWHLFVLAGSVFHFVFIAAYVPRV